MNTQTTTQQHTRRTERDIREFRNRLRERQEKGELVQLKGYSDYLFSPDEQAMFSIRRACRMQKTSTGAFRIYDDKGNYKYFRPLRLAYALLHGIGYDDIPAEFNIVSDGNGGMRVTDAGAVTREMVQRRKREHRLEMMQKYLNEVTILTRCYRTGDTAEAMAYVMQHRQRIVSRFRTKTHICQDRADGYFGQAVERFADTLKRPDSMLTNISQTMHNYMRIVRREHMQTYQLRDGKT